MKKNIYLGALTLIGFASCDEQSNEKSSEKDKTKDEVITVDDMCECAGDIMELGKKYQEDIDNKELEQEFEAKAKECQEMGEFLEKGKSEEEVEQMKKDFMESCEYLKGM